MNVKLIAVSSLVAASLAMTACSKKEEAAPAAPAGPTQEELLTQIRDLLKK